MTGAPGSHWTVRPGFLLRLGLATAILVVMLSGFEWTVGDRIYENYYAARPATLTVHTISVENRSVVQGHVRPAFHTPAGPRAGSLEQALEQHNRWAWTFRRFITGVELDIAGNFRERIKSVDLRIGHRAIKTSLTPDIKVKRGGRMWQRYALNLSQDAWPGSAVPRYGRYLNWRGDRFMLGTYLAFVALWGGLIALVWYTARTHWFAKFYGRWLKPLAEIEADERPGGSSGGGLAWFFGALAVTLGAAVLLEWKDSFFFTQDDNFSQFLPVILAAGRALFQGQFFDYNPHQFLGAPTVEVGTYALTYPFTYLSYALARWAGNENLTLEIFCIAHLVAGCAAAWWAARRWGAGAAMAAAMALVFALSGYAVVAGRSWYYMTPVFVWLPLAVGALQGILYRTRKLPYTVLLVLSLGLLFHAGNAQMWAYATGLTALGALLLLPGHAVRGPALTHLGCAGLGILALALPLLLPQLGFMSVINRAGGSGHSAMPFLVNLLAPWPTNHSGFGIRMGTELFDNWASLVYLGPGLAQAGLLMALAAACAFVGRLVRVQAAAPALWFALIGLMALILSFGHNGPLWYLHSQLPGLDKFTHPIKFLPFVIFFAGLASVLSWERLPLRPQIRARVAAGLATGAALLMTLNAWRANEAFHYFADDPYPLASARLAQFDGRSDENKRIFPVSPIRSTYHGFPESLQLNFPTVYGGLSFWGYDPLVMARPEVSGALKALMRKPVQTLREYGVTHLIAWNRVGGVLLNIQILDKIRPWQTNMIGKIRAAGVAMPDMDGHAPLRRVIELPGSRPLAFARDRQDVAVPLTIRGPDIHAHFAAPGWPGGTLVFNFLAYPRSRVIADGQRLLVTADEKGRVQAEIPQGARHVRLSYTPVWRPGVMGGLGLLALAAFGLWRAGCRQTPPKADHD